MLDEGNGDRVSVIRTRSGEAGDDPSAPPVSGVRVVSASDEAARTRLMMEITRLIHEAEMPEPARSAGLTLIGWLARRKQHEAPHALGIEEARQSERRLKAARAKSR